MNQPRYLKDKSYNYYSLNNYYKISDRNWTITCVTVSSEFEIVIPNEQSVNQALLLISLGLTKTEIEDQLGTNHGL